MIDYTIAIDPSINSLGYAIFRGAELVKYGLVKQPEITKQAADEERIWNMITDLSSELIQFWLAWRADTDVVAGLLQQRQIRYVIERPQQWGAYKSVASQHSGSLLILHLFVGACYHWARNQTPDTFLVPVSTWKGQLPKAVTQARMTKKYGVTHWQSNDVADAVGLGDWYITEGYKTFHDPRKKYKC